MVPCHFLFCGLFPTNPLSSCPLMFSPLKPLKKLRRRGSVRPMSSPGPSRGTPRLASLPGPERSWRKAQAIRAEDIYAAIRSGKSATVVRE